MKIALAVLDKLLHPSKWGLFSLPPIVFAALTDTLLKGKKQSAGIHDLLYVGVLPDDLDAAAERRGCCAAEKRKR